MELTFEQWKNEVNRHLINLSGVGCDDIEDWDYWNAYDDGMSPKVAAKKALNAAMGYAHY